MQVLVNCRAQFVHTGLRLEEMVIKTLEYRTIYM